MKKFLCFLFTVFAVSQFTLAASHKVRVEDPALAKTLMIGGAKVIGDYGSFKVLEVDDAQLGGAISNRVEISDDWNLIRLNAQTMDTQAAGVKALRKARGVFSGRRLHMVQFAGPVKPEWLEELKRNGVQIVSYIPENTYLIYGDADALARVQSWAGTSAFTQWEGEYGSGLKVHPQARAMASRKVNGKTESDLFAIQLLIDTNSNPATLALIDQLKTGPVRMDLQSAPYRNVVVALPADQLDTMASQPDVISVRPYASPKKRDERQDQILAGNLTGTVPSGSGYLAWLASKGFTQSQFDNSSFVVDVSDSGSDNGTMTPGHFGLYRLGNLSQSSRLAYVRLEGTLNPGGTLAGCDGHGALNTHIIANYDDFTGFQHRDSAGYSYGMGICPFVKVGSSVIFDNSSSDDYTYPDYNVMASDAYGSGARIASASWGTDVGGDYDFVSQIYDQLTRNAQSGTQTNREMTFVFAAGNAGPCGSKPSGIDSPGSAKNVITVGASENVRSLSIANGGNDPAGNDACGETDSDADSADDIDCGSSRGPCSDGRMKPDLVAPGVHITGGVPQDPSSPSPLGTGLAISCFDALGVCALPNSGTTGNTNNFFPLGQQFYTVSSGTSHSTPAVAGACALVRQFFINSNFTAPSPAMTKAFLINSARYMKGQDANDTLWSPNQGMGEVNLGVAFDGVPRFLRDQVPVDKFTSTGQRRAFVGHVADASKPVRVTLAWTDAPGNTSGAAYNNNLDLTVTIGGNTYKGNVFSGQYSTTGGKADVKNNVESVFLPAGATGDFTVTVTAANINSDGVPNEAPSLDQDFALVIYNGTAATALTYTPVASSYSGLFYEAGGPAAGRSGAVSLNTTASGSYSGKLQLGAKSYSFGGTLDSTGVASNNIVRKGLSTLGVAFSIDLTNNSVMTGTVTDPGNWSAGLRAERALLNPKSGSVPFAGRYTLIVPGVSGNAQLPGGDGYGAATVTSAGSIKLTGALADGTKLSQSAVVSAAGDWPLYVSLYGGQGQILGWLNIASGTIGGDLNWIRPVVPGAKVYPSGFNFTPHIIGSIYNPTASPLIGFTSGVIVLTGGNLIAPITNAVTISGTKASGANKVTLKLSAGQGTFKGTVPNPPNKAAISFSGVLLQNQNFGSGYFLGTIQSGRIYFGPAN